MFWLSGLRSAFVADFETHQPKKIWREFRQRTILQGQKKLKVAGEICEGEIAHLTL